MDSDRRSLPSYKPESKKNLKKKNRKTETDDFKLGLYLRLSGKWFFSAKQILIIVFVPRDHCQGHSHSQCP